MYSKLLHFQKAENILNSDAQVDSWYNNPPQ